MKKTGQQNKSMMDESAELAQALMNCPGLQVYIVQDGRFQYANELFQKATGYTEEELRDINTLDLVHPEDRELVREKAIENLKGHSVLPYEYRVIKKNGEIMWNLERLAPIQYRGKRAAVGSFMDITDRKQIEQALQDSESHLKDIFGALQAGVLIISADTHEIVDANPRAVELIGATKEKIVGNICHKFVCPAAKGNCPITDLGLPVEDSERVLINASGVKVPIIKSVKTVIVSGQKYLVESFQDISRLKKTQEALADEAKRRRILMDQSRDGICILNEDSKVVETNRRFAEMLGYTLGEARELHTWDWDTQWTREELLEMGHKVDEAGFRLETLHRRKDGTVFDVDVSINSVVVGGKKLIYCVSRDISERKKVEDVLADEAMRRRMMMEQSIDGISVLDENGKVIEANKRFAEMLGYSLEEVHELHVWDWDTDYTREELLEMARTVDEAGAHIETRHRRKDGTYCDVELSNNGVVVAGKKLVFCVSRDITERKKAEEALAGEAMRRRILMEQSVDGISVLDETCRVVEINKRFAEMLGYSPEEVHELHVWDWDTDHTREELLEMARTVDEAGAHIETRHRRKDGTYFDVELSNNGVVVAGKKLIFCVSRDISERKKAEEALRNSGQNFRDSIEKLPLGIRIVDKDERTIYANRELLDTWGYNSVEELEAVPKEQRYTPETYVEHMERINKRKRGEPVPLGYETGIVRSDGQVRILSVSRGELLWNGEKQFQIVSRDITESKKMEEALRRSEKNFRDSIENSPLGIRVLDDDGKTLYANRALLDLWGYSSFEELEAVSKEKRYTPQALAEHVERFAKRKRGEQEALHYETSIVRSDGQVRHVTASYGELFWGGQKCFQIVYEDITERKEAEEALRRSEQNFRDSIEKSPLGIRIIAKNGKHLYANRALLDLWGYSSVEEMEAVPREQRYTSESYVQHMDILEKRRRGEPAPIVYELSIVRSDGQIRHLSMSRGEVLWNGEQQLQIVYQDVTERKQAEQNFRDSIEKSPVGMHVIDKDGSHLYTNRALLDIWGYNSVEEMEAVPREQRYTPQSYAEHIERLAKRSRGEPAPITYELSIVRGDGQIRHLSVSRGEVMWNGEQQFQVVYQDITERKQLQEALAKSEERYRTVLDEMEDAYFEVDLAGNITFCNDANCRQLGYSREEMVGMNYRDYTPEENQQRVYRAFNHVYKTGRPVKAFPTLRIRKDGRQYAAETSAFPLLNDVGEVIGFRGVNRDVTDRAMMIKALSESEERYRNILTEIQEGYYEVDIAGNFTFVNDATCRQLGYTREELLGMNYRAYVHKEELKGVYKAWNKVYRTGKPLQSYPYTCIRKDGTQTFLEASVSALRSNEGKIIGFRSISRDVSEHREFERRLAEMATHDALTGLPNRRLLSDRFTMALALSRRTRSKLAVLMLDLDRFKAVNDSMGHDVGDQLLKAVAKRLENIVRKTDTVARIGGDEFVVLIPQVSRSNDIDKFTQRTLDAFREPIVFGDHEVSITTSIGVAVYPGDGKDIESLLKNADTAMYWAKEQGRDICKFYDGSEAATLLAKRPRA